MLDGAERPTSGASTGPPHTAPTDPDPMIAMPPPDSLAGAERDALALLADLARLPAAERGVTGIVRLELDEDGGAEQGRAGSLAALAARGWGIAPRDGVVRVSRRSLGLLAAVATRAAEQASAERDRHGRVPATANVLVAEGLERTPIVSRAAARLREAVIEAADRRPVRLLAPWPDARRWAVALTHDLDVVALWPAFSALRLGELLARRQWRRAAQVAGAALGSLAGHPVEEGVLRLLRLERDARVNSTWFILCGRPTLRTVRAGDVTYRADSPAARRILDAVRHAGHEIGLHGSFETLDRPELFSTQRARLAELTGCPAIGVRQHFLRLSPGRSEVAMANSGFAYDSTCGFSDRNGFRSGIADVHAVTDSEGHCVPGLVEVPFCWMDRALSKYRGVENPGAWVADALDLARACRAVDGLWVGVWHPNLTPALGFPGAPDAYRRLVEQLLADEPYVATLARMVRWRAARRSVRVVGLRPDGTVEARADAGTDQDLVLEDVQGRAVERVLAADAP